MAPAARSRGFSLVEMLIVVVILGILSTVTVFAVRGVSNRGAGSACAADARTVGTAAEAYMARYNVTGITTNGYPVNTAFVGNPAQAAVVAPAGVTRGATPGQSLVNAGFLKASPTNVFVRTDGTVVNAQATCGALGAITPTTSN